MSFLCRNPEMSIHFVLTNIIWNKSASQLLPMVMLISQISMPTLTRMSKGRLKFHRMGP